eukprot:CAMPEP_0170497788 /NCGR_PEP_ID=MMETSP0208-20121228/25805_1 /TAXON_ID=197538 /ORGANISM="Strombidium inclinatum, Strain S3" /LENGTH=108 /DNA_ID=CAMNT_0010774721 /DNA_START=761 /DNA_END=1088 /DNA_ORIENTATION=+
MEKAAGSSKDHAKVDNYDKIITAFESVQTLLQETKKLKAEKKEKRREEKARRKEGIDVTEGGGALLQVCQKIAMKKRGGGGAGEGTMRREVIGIIEKGEVGNTTEGGA